MHRTTHSQRNERDLECSRCWFRAVFILSCFVAFTACSDILPTTSSLIISPPATRPGAAQAQALSEPVVIGYDNANQPLELVRRQGELLERSLAVAFDELVAAAALDGVSITLTSGYRSRRHQDALIARHGLYSEGGLAARNSCHTDGVCVDLVACKPQWLRNNARRFGFVATLPDSESWHHLYVGPSVNPSRNQDAPRALSGESFLIRID